MVTTTESESDILDQPPPRSRSHHDYTVGWVCALPEEQTAALAMLDKQHPDLLIPSTDKNAYILGEIHGHNVVIACLPSGQIGNNPAVAVATRMISTFQSIRFGLLVGVGGGIPPKVRLGDIVVSTPTGQYPGVVQWDFGKMENEFKRTGALNNPPTILLTAISKLRTFVEAEGTKIPQYMDDLKVNRPRLAAKYLWNESLKDLHADGGQNAEAAFLTWLWRTFLAVIGFLFGWSTLASTPRPEVKEEDDERGPGEPRIHYGLIASGNQVIKNAKFRDNVNQSLGGDVLCFEMEAAGLMIDFPCIVIRGICDYADSKKAKDWQEYAAAIAAAYAKEFLSYVQSTDVSREKPAKAVMTQVLDYAMAIKSKLDRDEDLEILAWLTNIDYGPRHSDILRNRQLGTGTWFLDCDEYQSWFSGEENEILFCPGIPGAGKTTLTAIVVDHLTTLFSDDQTVGFAYIYCNFKQIQEQKNEKFLSSLLKQLAQTQSPLPDAVRKLYKQHSIRKTKPSSDEIRKVLHVVADTYSKTFIIIDALDECQEDDNCRTEFVSTLLQLYEEVDSVKLFVTSRPIPSIEEEFRGDPTKEIRADDEDVRKYLTCEVSSSKNSKLRECGDLVIAEILKAVDGMFLLAKLYFQSVSTKTTKKKIKTILETFGNRKGFDTDAYRLAYDGAMERIETHNKDDRELAKQVLMWIVYARRPLNMLELRCALAVEIGSTAFDEENMPDISRMISVCAGLVTMEKWTGVMRLVHYTAQEYFEARPKILSSNCQNDIVEVCATYLSYDVFEAGRCTSWELLRERLRTNALYGYAADEWPYHAYKSSAQGTSVVIGLLRNIHKLSALAQAREENLDSREPFYKFKNESEGLCFAARFGLQESVAAMTLLEGVDIEVKDTRYERTPLLWAASYGHYEVVEILLGKGASIEAQDIGKYTPLNASINMEYSGGETPLFSATKKGQEAVVQLLLSKGANTETTNRLGKTPLMQAASLGDAALVELLLNNGAGLGAISYLEEAPLLQAVRHGHIAIVKLLLDKGADVEARNSLCATPLLQAVIFGWLAVAELLLEKGANIEAQDCNFRTPLILAARGGHVELVKLLLDKGADIETEDMLKNRTPLSWATKKRHRGVIELLSDKRAYMNTEDGYLRETPLSRARATRRERERAEASKMRKLFFKSTVSRWIESAF
ncbi:hypothetical protein TWF281_011396 [Arthrobotrys megalospora]